MEAAQAEIVAPAFGDGSGERVAEGLLEERQIDMIELFLKVDRACCDNDAGVMLKTPEQSRYKIGEGFAGASASFNERMFVCLKGLLDAVEHFHLLSTVLEVGFVLCENAFWCEELLGIGKTQSRRQIVI